MNGTVEMRRGARERKRLFPRGVIHMCKNATKSVVFRSVCVLIQVRTGNA